MKQKCNFKYDGHEMFTDVNKDTRLYTGCALSKVHHYECPGEDNCIFYRIYLALYKVQPYQNKRDAELELKRRSKENPNMEYKLFPCSGGWLIEKEVIEG